MRRGAGRRNDAHTIVTDTAIVNVPDIPGTTANRCAIVDGAGATYTANTNTHVYSFKYTRRGRDKDFEESKKRLR